jgi:hypothetical protein
VALDCVVIAAGISAAAIAAEVEREYLLAEEHAV